MLIEMLFGTSTPFYKELYDKGIINSEFESDYEMSDTFAFCLLAGESDKPLEVLERVKKEIENFLSNGVSEQRFIQVRNTLYGDIISSCDNVSKIASMLISSKFSERKPFDHAQILAQITAEDIINRAKQLFSPLDIAVSVIKGE